jgi:hypothetical protein
MGGQYHTLPLYPIANYITERENTYMDTVSWALAATLMDKQKGTSIG